MYVASHECYVPVVSHAATMLPSTSIYCGTGFNVAAIAPTRDDLCCTAVKEAIAVCAFEHCPFKMPTETHQYTSTVQIQ